MVYARVCARVLVYKFITSNFNLCTHTSRVAFLHAWGRAYGCACMVRMFADCVCVCVCVCVCACRHV